VTTEQDDGDDDDDDDDDDESDDDDDDDDDDESIDEEKELDSQELDIEQQICQSQNETSGKQQQAAAGVTVTRDSDAASTLASIADSINAAIMNHQ
jgi:hypothetical protein